MIALIAREALTYAGRAFQAGDVFEAKPIDAAQLTYRRRALFAPKGAKVTPMPETEPPKRRYRRRDLQAED